MGNQSRKSSEKAQRLRAAARVDDGFFSTFVLRRISRIFTSWLVETRITPNFVTAISILMGFIAALLTSQRNFLLGALFLLLSLVLDCVDGEIARYKNQFSKFGAWLDALADRVKEFVYISALIYSVEDNELWIYGVALMILQTTRHLSDYNFARLQSSFQSSSATPKRTGVIYWLKKIIHLPIGERWLLLAILPVFVPVQETITALLILGTISFIYVVISRLRHNIRWDAKLVDTNFIVQQIDTLLPLRVVRGRFAWVLPSLLRALELIALALIVGTSSAANFWLIFAVAIWHYTNLYDALNGSNLRFARAGLHIAGRITLCFLGELLELQREISIALAIYLLALILLRGGHNVAKEVA